MVDGVLASAHSEFLLDDLTPASLRHLLPALYQVRSSTPHEITIAATARNMATASCQLCTYTSQKYQLVRPTADSFPRAAASCSNAALLLPCLRSLCVQAAFAPVFLACSIAGARITDAVTDWLVPLVNSNFLPIQLSLLAGVAVGVAVASRTNAKAA